VSGYAGMLSGCYRKQCPDVTEICKCYEQNKYIEGKSLYPEKYRNSECTKTSHFKSLYEWIWVIIALLASLIWLGQILDLIKKIIYK